MDLRGEYSDADLWACLELAQMKESVSSQLGGLGRFKHFIVCVHAYCVFRTPFTIYIEKNKRILSESTYCKPENLNIYKIKNDI